MTNHGPEAINPAEPKRKGVLVHCKAGVARSMTVVWAYLVLHCNMTVEAAEGLLREKRPQVAITPEKRALIQAFANQYQAVDVTADPIDSPLDAEMTDCHTPGWGEWANFVGSFTLVTCGWRALTGTHWNEILPGTDDVGPLYLSALPIGTWVWSPLKWIGGHDQKIIEQCRENKHELGLVISMVRKFEQEGAGLPVYPVPPETWAQHGVEQIVCPMKDFSNEISLKTLKRLADAIHIRRVYGRSIEPKNERIAEDVTQSGLNTLPGFKRSLSQDNMTVLAQEIQNVSLVDRRRLSM